MLKKILVINNKEYFGWMIVVEFLDTEASHEWLSASMSKIYVINIERTRFMGKHKKNPKEKSSVTIRDPHFSEFDTQKERNIQEMGRLNKPSHP